MSYDRCKDRQAMLDLLLEAGCKVRGREVTCPIHGDKHASAGLLRADSGDWLLSCRKCNETWDIWGLESALSGIPRRDLMAKEQPAQQAVTDYKCPAYPTLEDLRLSITDPVSMKFLYTNPDSGDVDLAVFRIDYPDGAKSFRQAHKNGRGWVMKAPTGKLPLYNRKRVRDADRVVVVEGEKAVHALHAVGVVATTSAQGANNGAKADWSPLYGKEVVLWPDNDEAGLAYIEFVRGVLERCDPPCSISVIDPAASGIPAKGDAWDVVYDADAHIRDDAAERVQSILSSAESHNPSRGLFKRMTDIWEGRRTVIPWPWTMLDDYTQALLPGTVTLICGEPGAGKSFWLLQALTYWSGLGVKVAVVELEEDREFYLQRMLAQASGISGLLDLGWIKQNKDAAMAAFRQHEAAINKVGRCIWERGTDQYTLAELAQWAEDRAKEGCRVIAIDPITVAETGAQGWLEDRKFTSQIERIVTHYQTSVILVTHPARNSTVKTGVLAGSETYPRTARTVLWLYKYEGPEVQVYPHGPEVFPRPKEIVSVNMAVRIMKARVGKRPKVSLAFSYASGMRFEELGEMTDE